MTVLRLLSPLAYLLCQSRQCTQIYIELTTNILERAYWQKNVHRGYVTRNQQSVSVIALSSVYIMQKSVSFVQLAV